MELLIEIRRYLGRPRVRPWALAVPILTLLVCLPLLRPLRHPDPRHVSDDEAVRLATVQAITEQNTLSIDRTLTSTPVSHVIVVGEQLYSDQPPAMSLLLAGPYWVMRQAGLTFENNPNLVAYLLTVLGTTLPVALAGGLVYRMGRVFELRRAYRMALAAAVIFGTGLASYGVVLNAHAPAAALLIASTGCLIHVAVSRKATVSGGWLAGAGLTAALAAVIEPMAAVFTVLLAVVPLAMRWRPSLRVGGVLLFVIGATPPVVLHAVLNVPVTGDLLPGRFHRELALSAERAPTPRTFDDEAMIARAALDAGAADLELLSASAEWQSYDDEDADALAREHQSFLAVTGRNLARLWAAFFGAHGILSHFPVLVFGVIGVFAVMHRHWPTATKVMAASVLVGGGALVLALCVVAPGAWPSDDGAARAVSVIADPFGAGSMFGAEPFVVFLPLVLFWSGAWLRKRRPLPARVIAGVLLAFSTVVTLIGATYPYPRGGYDRYTVAEALDRLVHDDAPLLLEPAVLAGGDASHSIP